MKFLEKVIVGILIGVITYLFLVPFIHELGHYIYAVVNGWKVTAFNVSIPALVTPSFVSVVIPTGTPITLFLMSGSFNTMIWGFFISLIPILLKKLHFNPYHYVFLSIGYGLISDSIVYPISDYFFFQFGDFYRAGFIPSLITVMFGFVAIYVSVGFNRIAKQYQLRL